MSHRLVSTTQKRVKVRHGTPLLLAQKDNNERIEDKLMSIPFFRLFIGNLYLKVEMLIKIIIVIC